MGGFFSVANRTLTSVYARQYFAYFLGMLSKCYEGNEGSLELPFKSVRLHTRSHSLPHIPYKYKNVDQLTFKINRPHLPAFSQKPHPAYVLARAVSHP